MLGKNGSQAEVLDIIEENCQARVRGGNEQLTSGLEPSNDLEVTLYDTSPQSLQCSKGAATAGQFLYECPRDTGSYGVSEVHTI